MPHQSQSSTPENNQLASVPFRAAFAYWLKLGFISFGGPAGQISMMHQELVEKRRWISEHRFLHALNYTMVLPGPEAQQLAIYIDWLMHGIWGGIVAGTLFVLPSFFILAALTWIYLTLNDTPAISGILYGIKPAVTAIVVFAAYRIGSRSLNNTTLKAIALAAFIAISVFNLPFPYIVALAGLIGYLGSRYSPEKFRIRTQHASSAKDYGPAVIGDNTPIPDHARFRWSRFIVCLVIGLTLWGGALSLLTLQYGWQGTLTQMGWFFTKAALMTFGGAYAVLPYVYQGSVEHYAWLSAAQMIDGLALGETTPGPLIMIVAFVGFVGGWSHAAESGLQLWAGIAGAGVATFFTFLPSFLFILLGGPSVEATRHDIKFTAPLTGITAAVVGVIASLAVFFAYHVLWPDGLSASFDWLALSIGIAAFAALFKYKLSIITVIGICAATGWLLSVVIG